jgi:hypothetical protein
MARHRYEDSVFINCPFDHDYLPIFHAIIFAVFDCGYTARCAQEIDDAGEVRIEKVAKIISACKFGIHDISRTEPAANNLPRFNMPLELGMFLGAKRFGNRRQQEKICLILDKEEYRYQAFISDIAGQDIRAHHNTPEHAIPLVRNWLKNASAGVIIPGGREIQRRYNVFAAELPGMCAEFLISVEELTFNDYASLVGAWLKINSHFRRKD